MSQSARPTRKALIKAARAMYQTDDINVDDNATVSRTEPKDDAQGAWVQAWVWVNFHEVKENG